MTREDDFDIDDLLEAPYKKADDAANSAIVKDESKKKIKKEKRSRSRSRSKDKERRRRSDRSRSKETKKKRSRSRSNSKERRRKRSRSRSLSKERNRRRSRSPERRPRRRSRSRSPTRNNRNKEIIHRSADGVTTISLRSDRERDEENLTQEERDARTVFIMQLARNVTIQDIQDFFNKVGPVCASGRYVRDVRLISDRNSRRSKGIGYVEFSDPSSVTLAIKLSGQRLLGVPIMVSPTMAEKNRFAAQQAALVKREGPMKLYVGSLHYNITETMLQAIFEPFGVIESVQLQYDPETNQSKGYGFVNFSDAGAAKRAMEQMDGFDLAGRPMKVNTVSERTNEAMSFLDDERTEKGGIEMNAQSRASLMQKLAQTHSSGLQVPTAPVIPAMMQSPLLQMGGSTCLVLSNLFDPRKENEPDWEQDYRNDVLEEVMKFGIIVHIAIDKVSPEGNVYLKCLTADVAGKVIKSFNGRYFAGRTIRAVPIPVANYSTMFPVSSNAVRPIKAELR